MYIYIYMCNRVYAIIYTQIFNHNTIDNSQKNLINYYYTNVYM